MGRARFATRQRCRRRARSIRQLRAGSPSSSLVIDGRSQRASPADVYSLRSVPADELKSAVLRFELDEPTVPRPIDDASWNALLLWAQAHNLVGQLWYAGPTVAVLDEEQQASLGAAYEEVALPALAIEASALEVHRLLGR